MTRGGDAEPGAGEERSGADALDARGVDAHVVDAHVVDAHVVDAHVVVERDGFALDASIVAAAGEVVAVMGPSGAGKSTLLAAIAGLVRPTGGRIRIGERTVDERGRRGAHVPPMRRGVVLLGQEPRLFPHLSARDNVAFALRTHGARRSDAVEGAEAWLDRVGLAGAGGRRPAALSGGQQQRVALARALAASPRAVLLDEPLTSLDAETAADIRTLLAEQLSASGTTAIVVTHDAVDAVALADRLVVLEEGVVTQRGATRDVLSAPGTRFAASIAGLNRLVGVARDGAWTSVRGDVRLPAGDASSADAVAHDGAAVAAVLPPSAVHLRPVGESPAAQEAGDVGWLARVVRLEATLGGVRVVTVPQRDAPYRLAPERAELGEHADETGLAETVAAELPVSAVADLALVPGASVRLRIDPRHVRLLRI